MAARKKKPVVTCDHCTKPYVLIIASLFPVKKMQHFCHDHKPKGD